MNWSRLPRPTLLLACGGLFAVLLVGAFFRGRGDAELKVNRPQGTARERFRDEMVEIGGVRRRRGELEPRKSRDADKAQPPLPQFGRNEPVPADANPQVASVAEALRTGKYPERLSPMVSPPPFDKAAYERDPQAYLDVMEPGRVWQAAQPGPGVPPVKPLNPRLTEIEQGQSVRLRVQAAPGAPVTFTSFDLGAFENRGISTTVRANADGIAAATFTGTPGTLGDVHILAAGPLSSGQVQYVVQVLPARRAPLEGARSGAASDGR